MQESKPHEGRNVKRIREILGIKQEALALDLGVSRQAVSSLEQKEALDAEMLEKIAAALKVPAEAIRSFNEEATFQIIANTYHGNSSSVQYNFNPMDKIVELYEQLLQSERKKVALLQKLLDKK